MEFPLFRFVRAADIDGGERRPAIIRLRQLSLGSQVKLVLLLALFTALAIFALLVAFQLAGAPLARSGRSYSVSIHALVGLILALTIAAIQIAALCLLRLLPWRGPSLKVEGDDHLTRIFE